jgi:leucyl-tRNA synthetase
MRYIDPRNDQALGEKETLMKWLPVTWYNGGMEHTTLHLLYSRFWYKFLFDIGLTPTSEPYMKRTSQGMILGTGGVKMSKSLGNVVNPDEIVKKFGADTLRMYEMFIGPFDQAVAWDDKAVIGIRRFVDRIYSLRPKVSPTESALSVVHKTIKKVGEDIESMAFNTAISSLMICLNVLEKEEAVSQKDFESFLLCLAPFAPFITEELWKDLGHSSSIHLEPWPGYDENKIIDDVVTYALQVNGKLRGTVSLARTMSEDEVLVAIKQLDGYKQHVGENPIKKQVFVPGKLVNIVI